MKDWERRMIAEIRELRLISEDIQALREHVKGEMRKPRVPDFIEDPRLRQEVMQLLNYTLKFQTVDINQTPLIPLPSFRGPDFEERLREVVDVDELVERDN